MKFKLRGAVVLLLIGLFAAPESPAQATNAPSRLSFDAFRVVSDRNIFNPNRFARSTGRPTNQARTSSRPATRVEAISLVGIMAYEKGVFAFFDGSGGNFTKALQVGGTVGEYTVKQITPTEVKLTTGTNTVELKVGMQLRREDEGDWYLSETSDLPRRRVVASTRPRTISRSGATGEAEMVGLEGLEPEVIVIDSAELGLQNSDNGNVNGNVNGTANGGAPVNGQQVRPEPAGEEITDPVLLRLRQRRQEMEQ